MAVRDMGTAICCFVDLDTGEKVALCVSMENRTFNTVSVYEKVKWGWKYVSDFYLF